MDYPFFFLRPDIADQLFTRIEVNKIAEIFSEYEVPHLVDNSRLVGTAYDPHSADQSQPMAYRSDIYFDGKVLLRNETEIMTILNLTIGRLTIENRDIHG